MEPYAMSEDFGSANYVDLPLPSQASPGLRVSGFSAIRQSQKVATEVKQEESGVRPETIKSKTSMRSFVSRGRSGRIVQPSAVVFGSIDKGKPLTPRKDDPPPVQAPSGGYSEDTFGDTGAVVASSNLAVSSGYNEDLDELVGCDDADFDDLDDDDNDAFSEYERDWNADFQEVLRKEDSFEKWDALSALSRDFVYAAKTYGKIIISEKYLPNEKKTIKPQKDLGGIAGGVKYRAQGIMFKFAVDTRIEEQKAWLYGITRQADEWAAKAANIELKSLIAYFNTKQDAPLLNYPLLALIDYRGFRLIAVAWLPIEGSDSIRYGSSDGGSTVFEADETLSAQMALAGKYLNLAGHKVGFRDPKVLYTCGDIEGHIGRDKRYYVLDFARVFPAEHFPEGNREEHGNFALYRRLRPELVKRNPEPLNSDAFSRFCADPEERRLGDAGVVKATRRLIEKEIPKFATMLTQMKAYELIDSQFNLCNEMHRRGINLRHLGRVREQFKDRQRFLVQRQLILTEIIARVAKNNLNHRMRMKMEQLMTPSTDPYIVVGVEYFNMLLSDRDFWSNPERLKKDIMFCFPRALFADEWAASYDLATDIDIYKLFSRLQQLTSFKLIPQCEAQLQKIPGKMKILKSDISKLNVRVKHIHMVDFAQAQLLSMQAQAAIAEYNLDQAKRLFEMADESFRNAHSGNTINPDVLFNWARELYRQSSLGSVPHKGKLDTARKYLKLCFKLSQNNFEAVFVLAQVLVDLGSICKGDEQAEFYQDAERHVRVLCRLPAWGDSGRKRILSHAAHMFASMPSLNETAASLHPDALDFCFVNTVSYLQTGRTKQDAAQVCSKFAAIYQWQKLALTYQPSALLFTRAADVLRRWAQYAQQEPTSGCSHSETSELFGRAASHLQMALLHGAKFSVAGMQYTLRRVDDKSVTTDSIAAAAPKQSGIGHLLQVSQKDDPPATSGPLGILTKKRAARDNLNATIPPSASTPMLATSTDSITVTASASSAIVTGAASAGTRTAPGASRRRDTDYESLEATFLLTNNAGQPAVTVSVSDRSWKVSMRIRNLFNLKDVISPACMFEDSDTTFKLASGKSVVVVLETDVGESLFHAFQLECSAPEGGSPTIGRISFMFFRHEVPALTDLMTWKELPGESWASRGTKHETESVPITRGKIGYPLSHGFKARAALIDATSGVELSIRKFAFVGSASSTVEFLDRWSDKSPNAEMFDQTLISTCFSDPNSLLTLLHMAKQSYIVDCVVSGILRHQSDRMRDRRRGEFHRQYLFSLRNDQRRIGIIPDTADLSILNLYANNLLNLHIAELWTRNFNMFWTMDLSGIAALDDETLRTMVRGTSQLASLTLKGCNKLTGACLDVLSKFCSQTLTHLAVWEDADEFSLIKICQTMIKLEHLDLSRCSKITNKSIYAISSLPKIRVLDLASIDGDFEPKSILKMLKSHSGRLTALSLSCESIAIEQRSAQPRLFRLVDDQFVAEIAKMMPLLTSLDLTYCNIGDAAAHEISTRMTKLEELSLKYNQVITEVGLAALLGSLHLLKSFSLRGLRGTTSHASLTPVSLPALASAGHLSTLVLSRCIRTREAGIALARVIDHNRSALKVIDLIMCSGANDITAEAIAKCANLTSLQLQGCESISRDKIMAIFRSCVRLYHVGVSGCAVDDASLEVLLKDNGAKSTSGVHTLLIGGCPISDAVIHSLCAYHALSLSVFDMRNTAISGVGFIKIAQSCRQLQHVVASKSIDDWFREQAKLALPRCIFRND